MNRTLVFLDTETTGNSPADRLCQLSFRSWQDSIMIEQFDELFMPTHPISIGSMAIHHIVPKMVADKPYFQNSPQYTRLKSLFEDTNTIVIAHNAPFDVTMLAHENIIPGHSIDTLKLVRHFDTNAEMEKHNLQYIRYYWNLDDGFPTGTIINPHDALSDVFVLEQLFHRMYANLKNENPTMSETDIINMMVQKSDEPALIRRFTFGKHNGALVGDIAKTDPGYLQWLLTQKTTQSDNGEDQADWIHTLEFYLNKKNLFS